MIEQKKVLITPYFAVMGAPAIEPISLEELKLFGRIDGTDEDALILGFIEAARQACENYLGRALIEHSITLQMDEWPDIVVELPRPPLISITAVETLTEDNVATVYDSTNYYIVTTGSPGLLIIKNGATPPENSSRYYRGYQIRYKAGYGSSRADVPRVIREALKLWTMDIYENRVVSEVPPPEAINLLMPYRMIVI